MNELLALEQWVMAHPRDKTAALALIDMREELLDVPHRVAVKAVAAIRKRERDALELAAAAKRLQTTTFGNIAIRSMIINATYIIANEPVQIVMRPGSRPPRAFLYDEQIDNHLWRYGSITVGARWVLKAAAEFDKAAFDFDHRYADQLADATDR